MILLTAILWALSVADEAELEVKGAPPKTIRGELIRENLKGIVLRGQDGPVLHPWVSLRSVDGRPARERQERVRLANKDAFCPDCRGGLFAPACPDCLGTSTVFTRSRACRTCGGRGTDGTVCASAGCEKGRSPCPGKCLKRDAGVWKEQAGMGRVRPFIFKVGKGGTSAAFFLTERHLGKVFEFKEVPPFSLSDCAMCHGSDQGPCARCRAAGTFVEGPPVAKGDCADCGGPGRGAGQAVCSSCLGTGSASCESCLGAGALPERESAAACDACRKGVVSCATCADSGLVDPKVLGVSRTPLQGELRRALARVGCKPFAPTDQLTLCDGRAIEGTVLQVIPDGILVLAGPETDLRATVLLRKHGFRRGSLMPPEAATPRLDTVVLKGGRIVQGRIVAKSDELLMIRTPEGETVRIEASSVSEVRPATKP